MKMKKTLAALLAMVLVFGLTACGTKKCGRDYDFRGNYSCNRSHSVCGNDSR